MTLEWSVDGPQISILVDLDQEVQSPTGPIGTVTKNPDNTWTAYDCTQPNQHGTTSMPLGTRASREEAKNLVETSFRTGSAEGPEGQLKADFTSNSWATAVERRWGEVCELLENHIANTHVLPADQIVLLLHELVVLRTISQYAGSNARTGWLIAVQGFRDALGV